MGLQTVVFKISNQTRAKLGAAFGHPGIIATPMELDAFIRRVVQENIAHYTQDVNEQKLGFKIKRKKRASS